MMTPQSRTSKSAVHEPCGLRIDVPYAARPVVIDGRLNETIWSEAPRYRLAAMPGSDGKRKRLHEAGTVRFAWNEEFFYVAAEFDDGDIVAAGTGKQRAGVWAGCGLDPSHRAL